VKKTSRRRVSAVAVVPVVPSPRNGRDYASACVNHAHSVGVGGADVDVAAGIQPQSPRLLHSGILGEAPVPVGRVGAQPSHRVDEACAQIDSTQAAPLLFCEVQLVVDSVGVEGCGSVDLRGGSGDPVTIVAPRTCASEGRDVAARIHHTDDVFVSIGDEDFSTAADHVDGAAYSGIHRQPAIAFVSVVPVTGESRNDPSGQSNQSNAAIIIVGNVERINAVSPNPVGFIQLG